ncbi:hypothetical protein LWI28_025684 [Acer negundo]|uniref:BAHD acyltransferase n=1 Tax=Acer negundo TaxID=4023 RepID=A0AAD5J6X4_ACENE|nr:hypothetical protein LWI28_025684 [Acer negundo]
MTTIINVEVISKDIIKPSTPTPDHLQHYQFSLLDQFSPSFYQPFIYFYSSAPDDHDHKLGSNDVTNSLKASLSEVLTRYYPLAGCLKETYVDCNTNGDTGGDGGGGVLFLEAQVSCQLSEILENPLPSEFINKFLPDFSFGVANLVLAVQVNFFKCGGVAVGVRMSHKISDALSLVTFINNWAATARGDGDSVRPEFVSATLFPPKDGINIKGLEEEKNIAFKRFVFTSSKIAALKEKYASKTSIENKPPTRVEALSCFLWSCYAASTEMNKGPEKLYMWINPVNVRKRIDPPLQDDSFGNLGAPSMCIISSEGDTGEGSTYGLTSKLREAISKINNDFLKRLKDGIFEHSNSEEKTKAKRTDGEELGNFYCSSFCRFPIYEADFGRGKPTWVAIGSLPYKNLLVLMDTKDGDGIEVWVQLTEEDMAKFEADQELLNYASPTLSCP